MSNRAAKGPTWRYAGRGSHLIITAYGHWLPNDLRGSGSSTVRKETLEELGPILPGRQIPQPPRAKVRRFFREAKGRLEHEQVWFDASQREIIAAAFGECARLHGYTIWACAICSNHAHVVVRTDRDRSEIIWTNLAHAARLALRGQKAVPALHPVWSPRPYKVFLHTPTAVRGRIYYANNNPVKEGLPRQNWGFVVPYLG
jgi:REP element-mobilizing transposase RayT